MKYRKTHKNKNRQGDSHKFGHGFEGWGLENLVGLKNPSETMDLVTKTGSQVEIQRQPEDSPYNYEIVWGNPLTGDKEGGIFASWLKINDFAIAVNQMEIGEYDQQIEIRQNIEGGGCNIVLQRE